MDSNETAEPLAQYLTFVVDGEEYGVDILRVQEIKVWESATHIPNQPPHVKGVINLRGTIVPIVDLRARFGLDTVEYGRTTVVIVLRVVAEERTRIMGMVVEAVSDVHDVSEEEHKPPPEMKSRNVRGLALVDDKTVIVLDVDRLFDLDELMDQSSTVESPRLQGDGNAR